MLYVWQSDSTIYTTSDKEFTQLAGDATNVLWLDLEADEASLRRQLEALQLLHPLSIDRIFTKQPRPFLDEYEDYLQILLQEVTYTPENQVELGVCHFIIGSHFLITIHSSPLTAINLVTKSLPPARFFSQGSDILFFHIVEPLISSYFNVLDAIAELTEDVEDRIFPKPDKNLLNELFNLKKDLITLRKSLAPMREVFSMLSRRENPFVDEAALPFMSHLYDLLIRLHEISDSQREIASGALEIYLSSVSNRTNEIMMTLTIVSTIILPPTFIVGYYGMNFPHMPEFSWHYGFLYVLALIIGSTVGLLWYFKKKHWF
jgi:magnesium transporter